MDKESRTRLIADWIEQTIARAQRPVQASKTPLPPAIVALGEIYQRDPESGWNLILDIVHTNQDDYVMMSLSSLLQRLINEHPYEFVERIETTAASDPVFKDLLGWMWLNEETEVWARVRKAAGDVWW